MASGEECQGQFNLVAFREMCLPQTIENPLLRKVVPFSKAKMNGYQIKEREENKKDSTRGFFNEIKSKVLNLSPEFFFMISLSLR